MSNCTSRVFVVFGALSTQGFHVVRSILSSELSHSLTVRAVVRRPTNDPDCQKLMQMGAQLFVADLNDYESVRNTVRGAWMVYLSLPVPLDSPNCIRQVEVFGSNVIASCMEEVGCHLIYNTERSPLRLIGISARHYDARAHVEQMIRKSGLKATFILMALPFESFFTILKPVQIEREHQFSIQIPTGPTPIDYASAFDVGPIVLQIMAQPDKWRMKTIGLTSGKLTASEICQTLNNVLSPLSFHDSKITYEGFRKLPFPGAIDWGNMFEFLTRIDQQYNSEASIQANSHRLTFHQWLTMHREDFIRLLNCQN